MNQISNHVIDKLFSSFTELEDAINDAKFILSAKSNVSKNLLDRIASYDEILSKQKKLANELCEKIASKDWETVSNIVSMINALSCMLRDDSREILQASLANCKVNENNVYSEEQVC